jgi:hypothetical protein
VHYGTRFYHRPYGYTPIRYVHYYHAPYRTPYYHSLRFHRTFDWYTHVYRTSPDYLYAHWIFYPAVGYNNGYWTIDNYPYFVFNGFRYRYSTFDTCNYQLVDKYDHRVVQNYWNQTCNIGYDSCSFERDRLNAQMGDFRYFCSETYRDQNFNWTAPTYDDSYYNVGNYDDNGSCTDFDNDGYCDENYDDPYYYGADA